MWKTERGFNWREGLDENCTSHTTYGMKLLIHVVIGDDLNSVSPDEYISGMKPVTSVQINKQNGSHCVI